MHPIVIKSPDGLEQASKKVLRTMGKNRILCLYGGMGAGKTTLIQWLCRELGVADNVVSPSFAIVNEYKDSNAKPVYHFDFYRIKKIEELFDFGYEEYFYSNKGICFIEWPELVEDILPDSGVIRLSIKVQKDESRIVEFITKG